MGSGWIAPLPCALLGSKTQLSQERCRKSKQNHGLLTFTWFPPIWFLFFYFGWCQWKDALYKASSTDASSPLLWGRFKTWKLTRASCYQHPLEKPQLQMSLLVARVPGQDGFSPPLQQDVCSPQELPQRGVEKLWVPGWGTLFLSHKNCEDRLWTKKGLSVGDVYNPLCLLPVLSPSGSTADQGNSCWHTHTQHRILSCTKSPKISFTNLNVCIPPLLPPHRPGNCKHCPASSPIHHTLTQSCGLWNHLPAVWLTKQQPHQTNTTCSPAPGLKKWSLVSSDPWQNKVRGHLEWGGENPSQAGNSGLSHSFQKLHFIIAHE